MRGNVQVAVRGGEVGQLEQSRPGLLPYINVVTGQQAKDADRLEPKGTVTGRGYFAGSLVDIQRHWRIEQT